MFIKSRKEIQDLNDSGVAIYKVNEPKLKIRTAHLVYNHILNTYNSKLFNLKKQSFISFNKNEIDLDLSDLLYDLSIVPISNEELTSEYLK